MSWLEQKGEDESLTIKIIRISWYMRWWIFNRNKEETTGPQKVTANSSNGNLFTHTKKIKAKTAAWSYLPI